MNDAYPKFIDAKYEAWFAHFVKTLSKCGDGCAECKALKEIVVLGTRQCLDVLYLERKRYLDGIDAVGLCLGYVSNRRAKKILEQFPYVKNKREELARSSFLKRLSDSDFPGLNACSLRNYCEHATPLMSGGDDDGDEDTLYDVLSELYKAATGRKENSSYPKMSIVEFVLLCFHVSGLLRLTANTVSHMWSEVIKTNSVLLLHRISTKNFDAIREACT